ncbi:MAG TPA: hypothetical protein VMV56_05780 [Williamwhitmania sp.]|nr:hypothetical protein [Williamwhitmania sp.]
MKKTFLVLVALAFVAVVPFAGCNTPAQKVDNAKDNVTQAKEDLDKANQAYLAEVETFKKESAAKTVTYDQRIAELKAKVAKVKGKAKVGYQKEIAKLERKNTEMKNMLKDYKEDGKDKWASFKTEFNHDMDELGQALKDFTVDNKK